MSFKGILDFGTGMAGNASLKGGMAGFSWAELEPERGKLRFDLVDAAIAPWREHGQGLVVRVSPSGWAKWMPEHSDSWTPLWVYQMGVKSVVDSDGARKPAYWDPKFLLAYQNFISQFAARFDGDKSVIAVELGIGDGGETKPDTRSDARLQAWKKIGYSNTIWANTIDEIVQNYTTSFQQTKLVVMPDNSFLEKQKGFSERTVVDIALKHKVGLQHNGIVKGLKPDPTWISSTGEWLVIGEQRDRLSQRPGETLADDIQAAIEFGCDYFMGFEEDLLKNGQTLLDFAAKVGK